MQTMYECSGHTCLPHLNKVIDIFDPSLDHKKYIELSYSTKHHFQQQKCFFFLWKELVELLLLNVDRVLFQDLSKTFFFPV